MRNFVSMFVLAMAITACSESSAPSSSVVDAGVVPSAAGDSVGALATPTDLPVATDVVSTPSVAQQDAAEATVPSATEGVVAPVR